jgi:hypothetical protein
MSSLVNILNQERSYPIYELLSKYLTFADFLVLRQVCRAFKGLGKASKLYAQLRRFVNDPTEFRSQLACNDGLISGVFALNIFEFVPRIVSHIDIVIQDGINADTFIKYIQENEKYQADGLEPVRRQPYTFVFLSLSLSLFFST